VPITRPSQACRSPRSLTSGPWSSSSRWLRTKPKAICWHYCALTIGIGTGHFALRYVRRSELTYCRSWFMEHVNLDARANPKQKPLLIHKEALSHLSEQDRRLLARARVG
jgi:hypothetical protein